MGLEVEDCHCAFFGCVVLTLDVKLYPTSQSRNANRRGLVRRDIEPVGTCD